MNNNKKPMTFFVSLLTAFSPFLIFSTLAGIASYFGYKTINIRGAYITGLNGLFYSFAIGLFMIAIFAVLFFLISKISLWLQHITNLFLFKNNKPKSLFISLLMVFFMLALLTLMVLSIIHIRSVEDFISSIIGLIAASFVLAVQFYFITKISIWIHSFINTFIFKRSLTLN